MRSEDGPRARNAGPRSGRRDERRLAKLLDCWWGIALAKNIAELREAASRAEAYDIADSEDGALAMVELLPVDSQAAVLRLIGDLKFGTDRLEPRVRPRD